MHSALFTDTSGGKADALLYMHIESTRQLELLFFKHICYLKSS